MLFLLFKLFFITTYICIDDNMNNYNNVSVYDRFRSVSSVASV